MVSRKIQLIAGTTYTVSLPKDWVKKNNLSEKDEVVINETNDKNLVISPIDLQIKSIKEISINVDDYKESIDQILFAMYYFGIEHIKLFSKKEPIKNVRSGIINTLKHMSGTEITYEDKNAMTIDVLLDKSRVDIIQVIYRIGLIIGLSISNIMEGLDINEIKANEEEIDRLFHLLTKIISLSLLDANLLYSSKIKNVSLIPFYFLISKRLENIGDNIYYLAEHLHKSKIPIVHVKELLNFIKIELNRSIRHIMKGFPNIFIRLNDKEIQRVYKLVSNSKNNIIADHLGNVIRYIVDTEEEIVNMSFYSKLISQKEI
ncbi:MAG: phosphate uptake regulator PhoU [Nanoarchaeota archaeon]|nr:phosphate uptake regulator PhoU [Nanoarchaeota archaeon]